MGLQTVPGYIGQTGYQHPVELMRNLTEGIFTRTGAIHPGDFAVTPMVGQLGVSVAAGMAVIVGSESGQQGAYFIWSDGPDNVLSPTPSGSQRWDTLLVRVVDPQYGAISGSPRTEYEMVSGVAGAGAPRPDSDFNSGGVFYVPGAWARVADIRIDPTDTSVNPANIVWRLGYTRSSGAALPVTSATRPPANILQPNDRIYETDTTLTWVWTGSAWTLGAPYVRRQVVTGSPPSVITFNNIPSSLNAVKVAWSTRSTDTGYRSRGVYLKVNNDSTAGRYRYMQLQVSGTSLGPSGSVGGETFVAVGLTNSAAGTAGLWGNGEIRFQGWSNPHTQGLGMSYESLNATGVTNGVNDKWWVTGSATYMGSGPFTRLDFTLEAGNWEVGSEFVLVGYA